MFTTGMGYAMPAFYSSVEEEARRVRTGVGVIDVSQMGRLDIKGRDALRLVQYLIVNNAERLADGQALYSVMCTDRGLIHDDVTVLRFGAGHLRVITSSMFRARTLAWIQKQIDARGADAHVTDVSSSLAMIGVQGPKSRDLLSGITDIDLSGMRFFRFASGSLLASGRPGAIPCLIARLGYSGELGYECYVNTEDAHAAWDLIMEAGRPHGALPYGMETLDALRWEKGFVFYGVDVTDANNPYECGLSAFIRYDCGEFLGREALLAIREKGPARKLIGLEVDGEAPAPDRLPLLLDGERVGAVVAGFRSATLGKNLAYAWVNRPHFRPGTGVRLEIEGAERAATVVEMPFYDPEGLRMRM